MMNQSNGEFVHGAGPLYRLLLTPPNRSWFGVWDMFYRFLLPFVYYYWAMVTSPISFFLYTVKYNLCWYGPVGGIFLSCGYLVLPFLLVGVCLWKKVEKNWKTDCWNAGPGRVFFVEPEGFFNSLLWACAINISNHVGLFLMCGNSSDAVNHSWYDYDTTKDFWRSIMEVGDVRMPRELARFSKGTLEVFHKIEGHDIVVKITDSYLGIGDLFLTHGEDFNTQEELEEMLRTTTFTGASGEQESYMDKETLILELVRPCTELEVHSFDIVTIMTLKGAKVLTCVLWSDCTTSSSHSTNAGYLVDVEKEEIVDAVRWYSAYFGTMEAKRIGTKVPGVRKAVEAACRAHEEGHKRLPFLKMVGWDSMIDKKGDMVFFEGNFAASRLPRRMFLAIENLMYFISGKLYD